jgi:hypothetical protein
MEPLAARHRLTGDHDLPDQFVGELKAGLRVLRAGFDTPDLKDARALMERLCT